MLRLLTVLLWLPISTQANVYLFENQETRLELSEILSGMDSTESILLFFPDSVLYYTSSQCEFYSYSSETVRKAIDLLQKDYIIYKQDPYVHSEKSARELLHIIYQQLFPKTINFKNKIRVVGFDYLSNIPWNFLIDNEGSYAFQKWEIIYSENFSRKDQTVPTTADQLSLKIIAPIFEGSQQISNQEEKKALESRFKSSDAEFSVIDILHVSSHGYRDSLVVASGEVSTIDKVLQRKTIRLAFLNCCYSTGTALKWLESGVKGAIGTQWQVEDERAIEIAQAFYDELLDGQRSAQALRNALLKKHQSQSTSENINPFAWGGYQYYGQDDHLIIPEKSEVKRFLSVALSICTTFSLLGYYFGDRFRGKLIEYNLV